MALLIETTMKTSIVIERMSFRVSTDMPTVSMPT
jgi:hypothetical protein